MADRITMTSTSDTVPTKTCAGCGSTVPVAAFCGCCGAEREGAEDRLHLLRPQFFASAPTERVWAPMVISSIFPHLPQSSRIPFRIGLLTLLIGLTGCSILSLVGPLITIAALGVPLLFGLYLWQSGLLRDIPGHALVIAATMGGSLGIGWVLLTGGVLARSYGIPMAAGLVLQNLRGAGLVVSVGGGILMAVPTVLIRLLKPPTREALDGFVIGALGALAFSAAATTTRLAPQFVSGLTNDVRPTRLLVEAVLYGVAAPLTAAATGGLLGILLWFRPGERAGEHPGAVRFTLLFFSGLVAVIYSAIWVIDAARLPKWPQLALHILIAVIALLAVRICVQLALLHEEPDPHSGTPVLCVHCDRVVPDMAFCPACGAAARASSRSSRRLRREYPPVREVGTIRGDV
ncbi:MAG: zinc ribbon domain-containing protein [Mycobacteriaceae bacterium]